jgi:hypothetical protein
LLWQHSALDECAAVQPVALDPELTRKEVKPGTDYVMPVR